MIPLNKVEADGRRVLLSSRGLEGSPPVESFLSNCRCWLGPRLFWLGGGGLGDCRWSNCGDSSGCRSLFDSCLTACGRSCKEVLEEGLPVRENMLLNPENRFFFPGSSDIPDVDDLESLFAFAFGELGEAVPKNDRFLSPTGDC